MQLLTELSSWLKKNWVYIAILWLLVGIAYFNSLQNELVSDDISAIKENELLRDPQSLFLNVRFISRMFLYFLAYQISGILPLTYRLINIFFHIGVVTLVYALVPYFSKKKFLAFIVAALTAVHPIMVESVSWISGGIYAQSTFFLLLSFLFYIRNNSEFKISRLIWSLFFYILALSSSEKIIVFPIILLLYEFCFYSIKQSWKRVIPYILIAILWSVLLIPQIGPRLEYFKTNRGTEVELYNPIFQIPSAVGGYLHLFLWPDILSHYQYDLILSFGNVIMNWVLFLLFLGSLIYSFFKHKLIFFWLTFFIISLGVTLNPFGFSWLLAERYSYLGMIGLNFIAGYFLSSLIEKKKFTEIGFILFVIIVFLLSVRTIIRNNDWKNPESLWLATAKTSPSYVAAQNNAASTYVLKGEYGKAIEAYKKAIELNPNYSYSYFNLGYTLRLVKQPAQSIPILQKAIELNPNYWKSYEQLGGAYYDIGDYENSEKYIRKAVLLAPNVSMLYAQLGTLELQKGKIDEAKESFKKAISLDPNNAIAIQELKKLE